MQQIDEQKNGQLLDYEIIFNSGEEKDYRIDEIKKNQQKSKGWQSQRFCEYPQEIIIKLNDPSQIKQIQFLSHQSKICQKLEIYINGDEIMSKNTEIDVKQIKFKKLGYLQFDDNQRSNFQARELKSVYIDNKCVLMKLVMHKCHINKYNLFNQIGLISLQIYGIQLQQQQQQQQYFNIHHNVNNNNAVQIQLKNLQAQKARAIQNEDFDLAQQLKDQIEKIQSNSNQLNYLEERKQIAVNNEDYESAQIIKKEIDKIKSSFQQFANKQQQQQISNNYQENYNNEYQNSNNNRFTPKQNQKKTNPTQEYNYQQQFNNIEEVQEEENIEDLKNKYKNKIREKQQSQQQQKQQNYNMNNNDNKISESELVRQQNLRMSQPIRGVKETQQNQDYEQENTKMTESIELDELNEKQKQECRDIIEQLGEENCKKLYCKNFKIREQILENIVEELKRQQMLSHLSEKQLIVVAERCCQILINDKIVSVQIQCMVLIRGILKRTKNYNNSSWNATNIQNILGSVIEKLGDNNSKIKEQLDIILELLVDSKLNLAQYLVNVNGKQTKNIKHMQHRLKALHNFIINTTINYGDYKENIAALAKQSLENSNSEIRQSAILILQTMVSQFGQQGVNLEKVKQVHLDAILEQQQQQPNKAVTQRKQQEKIYEDDNDISTKQQQIQQQQECEFCMISRIEFKNDKQYDQHLVKECAMLTECVGCTQIIQIFQLNDHLLNECEAKEEFKKCNRCKEPVAIDIYQQHIRNQECLPYSSSNGRCALCHTDIKQGQQGLRAHIFNNQCEKSRIL